MTYDSIEKSEYSSRPVELYEFHRQNTYWRYTSADSDQTYDLYTYTAKPISRGCFKCSSESVKSDLDIECDPSLDVLSQYVSQVPYDIVYLKITRYFPDDGTSRVLWQGRITSVKFNGLGNAEITCESIYAALRRQTLRRCWQKACPHALYSQGYGECMVDKEAFKAVSVVSLVSGMTMTLSTNPGDANYFQGGYLVIEDNGDVIRRYIRSQDGAVLVMDAVLSDDYVGFDVALYPGCDHSMNTCISKFNNVINYGGHPWIPEENPMGGSLVF